MMSENKLMTHIELDLEQERCPMSLLLVKRAYKALGSNQTLKVRIIDRQSVRDCSSYLIKHKANVQCQQQGEVTVMTIVNKKDSEC
jgi:TusA-related sulfurtransferase